MSVLTRAQLKILEAVNRGDEYAGNWSPRSRGVGPARECELKGLLLRVQGELPPWRLTPLGRTVLREAVERSEL
jgi:hypothetical protein